MADDSPKPSQLFKPALPGRLRSDFAYESGFVARVQQPIREENRKLIARICPGMTIDFFNAIREAYLLPRFTGYYMNAGRLVIHDGVCRTYVEKNGLADRLVEDVAAFCQENGNGPHPLEHAGLAEDAGNLLIHDTKTGETFIAPAREGLDWLCRQERQIGAGFGPTG
jgi:hypothetical protein